MLYPIKTIVSGGGGGGTVGDGDTIRLGTPSDGTYEDGAAQLNPLMTIANAVDEINELLAYLLPQAPQPLSGYLILSGTTPKSGYIANYSNLGSLTAGSYFTRIISSPNFTLTTPNTNKFSKADKGVLKLVVNGSEIDSFYLASAFNESERSGCQSYPPENSTLGYLTILSVCWYNNFPAYQIGRARANIDSTLINVGYNSIRIEHQIDTVTNATNNFECYYDDGGLPSIDNFSVSINNESFKYLSGIKYYSGRTNFNVSISASNIFNKTYVEYPIVLSGTIINTMNIRWNDPNTHGFSNPPYWSESWNYDGNVNFKQNVSGTSFNFTVIPRDPFGSGISQTVSFNNYLYNTYQTISTDTHEYFVDEIYRLTPGEFNDYDNIPTTITNRWNSTNPLSNGHAQVFCDKLVYPTINFNDSVWRPIQESGRDYSSFTGPQIYYRAIRDVGTPHSNGSLHLRGITWTNIENGDVKIEIKLPTQTGWLDLSQPFNAATFSGANGDGAMTSYQQDGDVLIINWSAGLFTTANSGYMYIIRITLNNNSIEINEIWDFE